MIEVTISASFRETPSEVDKERIEKDMKDFLVHMYDLPNPNFKVKTHDGSFIIEVSILITFVIWLGKIVIDHLIGREIDKILDRSENPQGEIEVRHDEVKFLQKIKEIREENPDKFFHTVVEKYKQNRDYESFANGMNYEYGQYVLVSITEVVKIPAIEIFPKATTLQKDWYFAQKIDLVSREQYRYATQDEDFIQKLIKE